MHRTNRHEVRGVWSVSEHERFIEAMTLYPTGPWKLITEHVGTRSIKQVQTHAQKYQQKLLRHQRGLRKRKTKLKRPEHRVDKSTFDQFTHGCIVRYAQKLAQQDPSLSPHSPTSCSSSSDESSSVPGSPQDPVINLAGITTDDWDMITRDISKDSEFMTLLEDVEPVPPIKEELPLPQALEWNEWQFEDLLQPFEGLEAGKEGYFDGAELKSREKIQPTECLV